MSVRAFAFRYRGLLIAPPLFFAVVCFRDETESPLLVWVVGGFLVLSGILIRIWAQQHLRHRLKMSMQLTTTGPYQFVRNPLYLGNTIIYLGATVSSELLWMVPITLLWCLTVYSLVVRYEEERLEHQYGEAYGVYKERTPRWLPRGFSLRLFGLANENLRRAVLAELHCALVLLPYLLKEFVSPFLER